MRNLLLDYALLRIPRLIGMTDSNPYSRTYGCMDRNYWHYKKFDFPSGMYQLGSLSLAHAYVIPESPWHKNQRIRELSIAAIRYMEKCSHKDGSCDEFYPFERALGATAFTLYAGSEAYMLLRLNDAKIAGFFRKRADWLIGHDEPSAIANHLFGSALALANVYIITRDRKYLRAAEKKIHKAIGWQSKEGWFLEYEGCDPGYMTFTVDFLAKYLKKTGDKRVIPVIKKAVDFCSYFMHPDGSYGGIYGSRSTSHFMPCGFELFGNEAALRLVDSFLAGMAQGKAEYMDDDTYFFYQLNNFLEAYTCFKHKRPGMAGTSERGLKDSGFREFEKYFPEAKLFVISKMIKKEPWYAVISLSKGGVCKVFRGNSLLYSDSGFVGIVNRRMVSSQAFSSDNKVRFGSGFVEIEGHFHEVRQGNMSPTRQAVLRAFNITAGRSFVLSSLLKRILVKKLITGKKRIGLVFRRRFSFYSDRKPDENTFGWDNPGSNKLGTATIDLGGIRIENNIALIDKSLRVGKMSISCGFSAIYVPTSRYYEDSVLGEWKHLRT